MYLTKQTEAITWRKANQVHKWFVDNVQNGKDNCELYPVSYEKLMELKKLCEKALKTKDGSILPPQSGFFFGSTDFDQWYWDNIELTRKQLSKLEPDVTYFYQSSW